MGGHLLQRGEVVLTLSALVRVDSAPFTIYRTAFPEVTLESDTATE